MLFSWLTAIIDNAVIKGQLVLEYCKDEDQDDANLCQEHALSHALGLLNSDLQQWYGQVHGSGFI